MDSTLSSTNQHDNAGSCLERTLVMIKPNMISKSDQIIPEIEQAGFVILQQRRVRFTPEQASDFYAEHYGKMFFPSLIAFMSSGPTLAMVVAKRNAINGFRQILGPTNSEQAREVNPKSFRARYGTDTLKNAMHGSESQHAAEREIRFIFPDSITEPILSGDESTQYLEKKVNQTLIKGLTELCKTKPAEPIRWLANWLLVNNPNQPRVTLP
ncbi:Nucleoside diphosphate kinase-like protein 5-like [Oopsacas minuta]|uniref:Nucleoside diphosphate kinase homolog 5 n=1 Tax=Oopsacas minuta TaxID=111878 RepID=A0AAV7JV08_9METZ|nr:Nucleoside diphosphate kinase-like protein 5-like [Oopsacas minuta]